MRLQSKGAPNAVYGRRGMTDLSGHGSQAPVSLAFVRRPPNLGEFMFGNGRQEAGRRPSFTIGLLGKLRPQGLDRRQSEFIEHDAEASLIDVDVLHATSPAWAVPIRAS